MVFLGNTHLGKNQEQLVDSQNSHKESTDSIEMIDYGIEKTISRASVR